jgi:hypothetical protein
MICRSQGSAVTCVYHPLFTETALTYRGWNSYNKAPLNNPQHLNTSTYEVKEEHNAVLHSYGIDTSTDRSIGSIHSVWLLWGGASPAAVAVKVLIAKSNRIHKTAKNILVLLKMRRQGRNIGTWSGMHHCSMIVSPLRYQHIGINKRTVYCCHHLQPLRRIFWPHDKEGVIH